MYWSWITRAQLRASPEDDEIIRVLVIDKNVSWRETVATLLNRQPDMEVIGSNSDTFEAHRTAYHTKPDVVFIDSLPSSEAEWAIFDQFKHMFPEARFVLHTTLRRQAIIEDLNDFGVTKYLLKGSSPTRILRVVREVCLDDLKTPDVADFPAK